MGQMFTSRRNGYNHYYSKKNTNCKWISIEEKYTIEDYANERVTILKSKNYIRNVQIARKDNYILISYETEVSYRD